MLRLFGWLSRLIFQSVLIGSVSLITTWTIIDLYIDKLLQQFAMEQVEARITPADLFDHLANKMVHNNTDNGLSLQGENASVDADYIDDHNVYDNDVDPNNSEVEANHADANQGADQLNLDSDPNDPADPAQYVPTHGAIPVWGREEPNDGSIRSEVDLEGQWDEADQLAMTAEEFNRKKEEMSEEDKAAVFSLLVTRVPQETLMAMSVLLEDGLTHEELKEIEEMIADVLSEEEMGQLLEIIDKY